MSESYLSSRDGRRKTHLQFVVANMYVFYHLLTSHFTPMLVERMEILNTDKSLNLLEAHSRVGSTNPRTPERNFRLMCAFVRVSKVCQRISFKQGQVHQFNTRKRERRVGWQLFY